MVDRGAIKFAALISHNTCKVDKSEDHDTYRQRY
uniref:Uncharacterized protein n=1 Tax=Zea mays TaxID=4577 RepID=B6SMD1_MAIZE|nr:hypothetical protein [Zea mays]